VPETLEDILPPAPHKVVKEAVTDIKNGIHDMMEDVKTVAVEMAPHNLVKGSSPKEFLPPPPPKPPKPPRFND